jgi:hypothetical protein
MTEATGEALILVLHPRESNEEIFNYMRLARTKRNAEIAHIVCHIGGYDDDERELWEIPEVRAFCRRLMTLGFPSWLDPFTTLPEIRDHPFKDSFGSLEIWLVAKGKMSLSTTLDLALVKNFLEEVLPECNLASDRNIGK